MSLTQVAADAWRRALEETPADGFEYFWSPQWTGYGSYREWIHRPRKNARGDVIPRITLVRNNIRALGKPKTSPRLP
jgi:hypothetical protein